MKFLWAHVVLALGDAVTERIVLTDATSFGAGAPEVLVGDAGSFNFSPVLAAAPGGGAVAWYRNISGFSNELWVQPFAFDGAAFTLGTARRATLESVPPHAPALTHIRDDVYFVAWSEGANPAFRLKGVFLELE